VIARKGFLIVSPACTGEADRAGVTEENGRSTEDTRRGIGPSSRRTPSREEARII